jgi:hypothetical protein
MNESMQQKLDAWAANLPTRKPGTASANASAQVTQHIAALDAATSDASADDALRALIAVPGVTRLLGNGGDADASAVVVRRADRIVAMLLRDDSGREHRVACQQAIAIITAPSSTSSSSSSSTTSSIVLQHFVTHAQLDALLLTPLQNAALGSNVLAVISKLHSALWDRAPNDMLAYLRARGEPLIAAILDQLALSSAFDMLGKIIRLAIYEPQFALLDFFHHSAELLPGQTTSSVHLERSLFDQLIDRFHPKYDPRLHDGALYAIQELATAALIDDRDTLRYSRALRRWLAHSLLSDALLDRLLSMTLSKGTTPSIISSRLVCLRAVHSLLALRRSPRDTLVGELPADVDADADGAGATFPVRAVVLRRFAGLRAMTADVQRQCSGGPPIAGLRSYRYDLFRFIATLAELHDASMFDAFAQHGLTGLLLETFLAGGHNYFVAGCVQRVLTAILCEASAVTACTDALDKCRLLSRLVLADQAHRQTPAPQPRPGAGRCLRTDGRHSEHGAFLSSLFQLIADAAKINADVQKAVLSSATFLQYAKLSGHRDASPLGGSKPTVGSSHFASPFAMCRSSTFWDRRDAVQMRMPDESDLAARWDASAMRKFSIGTIKTIEESPAESSASSSLSSSPRAAMSTMDSSAALLLPLAALLTRAADTHDDPALPLDQPPHDRLRAFLEPYLDDSSELAKHVRLAESVCEQHVAEQSVSSASLSELAARAAAKRFASAPPTEILARELVACCGENKSSFELLSRDNVQHTFRVCGLEPSKRPALNAIFDELDADDDTSITQEQFSEGLTRMVGLLLGSSEKLSKSNSGTSKRSHRRNSSTSSSSSSNGGAAAKDKEQDRARRKAEKLEKEREALAREQEAIEAELAQLSMERELILKDVNDWAKKGERRNSKSKREKK